MIVLFIAFLIYYKVSVSSSYRIDKEESVFQYFYDKKYEYKAIVTKNRKGVIVDYKAKDISVSLDSTPIYLKNGKEVIFPSDMSVVMPTMGCAEYLSPHYSYITFENNVYMLTTNRYHDKLNHYFLYDGMDMYFFIEDVTLKINQEEIKLSPYSYVMSKYNSYVSYYDKKSDTYKTIDVGNSGISVYNDYYTVLVDKDIIDYQGNVILTSKIDRLNTIDKKG